jgi:hypothetical protein
MGTLRTPAEVTQDFRWLKSQFICGTLVPFPVNKRGAPLRCAAVALKFGDQSKLARTAGTPAEPEVVLRGVTLAYVRPGATE